MKRNKKKLNTYHVLTLIVIILTIFIIGHVVINKNTIYLAENLDNINLELGEEYQLRAVDENNEVIIYESKDPTIASVDENGKIFARKSGKTFIYVGTQNKMKQKKVGVNIPYKKNDFDKYQRIHVKNKPNLKFEVNTVYDLDASIDESFSKGDRLIYSSSNTNIASIDDSGKLKMLREGVAKITVQIENTDIKEEYDIHIFNKIKKVQKIIVNKNQKNILEVGDKMNLNVSVFPEDADNKGVKFSSSESTIASINEKGEIKAIRPGITIINMISEDGNTKEKFKLNISRKKAYLTNEILKTAGIDECNKVMFVAHPDDESLWDGGHLLEDKYFVVCMTNEFNSVRKKEFYKALEYTQDKGIILPYPDLVNGNKSNWNHNKEGVKEEVNLVLSYKPWDEIVTHSPRGETGHRHHKFVSQIVTSSVKNNNLYDKLLYFGKFYEKNEVPSSLESNLKQEIIDKKYKLLDIYAAEKKSIEAFWKQMVPFEYWKKAVVWKDN